MARIRDYTPDVGSSAAIPGSSSDRYSADPGAFLDRSANGSNSKALNSLAQGLDSSGDALYAAASRQEATDVATNMAKARADWTVNLQQRAATMKPGDPNFAHQFNGDFADYMSKMGDNISTAAGRAAFERGKAEMSGHFLASASAIQIHSAGVKATQDFLSARDSWGNTLLADPRQFESVMKDVKASLNDPNGQYAMMPPDRRAMLERDTTERLAQSAVQGTIRELSPAQAIKELEGGKWDNYLLPQVKNALINTAQQKIHAEQVAAEHKLRMDEYKRTLAAERANDGFVRAWFKSQQEGEPFNLAAVINDPTLKSTQKEHWMRIIATEDRREDKMRTDPDVYLSLFRRIHLPDEDPLKIRHADELLDVVGNGINMVQLQQLRGEITGRRTPEGAIAADLKKGLIKTAEDTLTMRDPMLPWKDPKGQEQLQRYMSWMLPEFDRQIAAGKTAAQLTSPDSPDYLGKSLPQFTRTREQKMNDMIDANPTYVPGSGAGVPGLSEGPARVGDIPSRATRTGKIGGVQYYEIDGKWVDKDGKPAPKAAP